MVTKTDGTETQDDVALVQEETETSEEQPEFTKSQFEAEARVREQRARSDALSDIGRLQREATNAMKAAEAAQERVKKMLKEQEDFELQTAEGNTEQLSAVKERIQRRQIESELEDAQLKLNQRDEELSEIRKASQEVIKQSQARAIAERLGVDADRLISLSRFTDGSAEAMEGIAKELPKATRRPPVKTDLGGRGGGGGRTFAEFEKEYIAGNVSLAAYEERARKEGKL